MRKRPRLRDRRAPRLPRWPHQAAARCARMAWRAAPLLRGAHGSLASQRSGSMPPGLHSVTLTDTEVQDTAACAQVLASSGVDADKGPSASPWPPMHCRSTGRRQGQARAPRALGGGPASGGRRRRAAATGGGHARGERRGRRTSAHVDRRGRRPQHLWACRAGAHPPGGRQAAAGA